MNILHRLRTPSGAWTVCLALLSLSPTMAHAGPGHDHDHDEPSAAPATHPLAPRRQADGSVVVPQPTQGSWGLRTAQVNQAPHARAHTLPGTVVMDPNAGGVVQAMQAGRLEPGPQGLPTLGQTVRRGQVLAYTSAPVRARWNAVTSARNWPNCKPRVRWPLSN
jgi:membrane fusion protein, heavy metal efflux system